MHQFIQLHILVSFPLRYIPPDQSFKSLLHAVEGLLGIFFRLFYDHHEFINTLFNQLLNLMLLHSPLRILLKLKQRNIILNLLFDVFNILLKLLNILRYLQINNLLRFLILFLQSLPLGLHLHLYHLHFLLNFLDHFLSFEYALSNLLCALRILRCQLSQHCANLPNSLRLLLLFILHFIDHKVHLNIHFFDCILNVFIGDCHESVIIFGS